MIEQGPKGEESIEKVFANIQEAIQPVISGDREKQSVLAEHGGIYIVYFPTIYRLPREVGGQVLEWLQSELGSETTRGYLGKAREIDEDHYKKPPWLFLTKYPTVRLVRTEVFKRSSRKREGVVWSVRNLEPKSRRQKAIEKAQRLRRRIRQNLTPYQYIQG